MTAFARLARALLGAVLALAATAVPLPAVPPAPAVPPRPASHPVPHPRFWEATDSATVPVAGAPTYSLPSVGGPYGGYIGMVGDWARWQGCARYWLAWSAADAAAARANLRSKRGIGVGGYWFMAGPGVDPRYDGTVTEARRWGEAQAAAAVGAARARGVETRVLFMDVELPGSTVFDPVPDNGWKAVYRSTCSPLVRRAPIPAAVDRATVDGFASWVRAHSPYLPGVYSAAPAWSSIFGTGAPAALRGLPEWTYGGSTGSLRPVPSGWCRPGGCARWFGGVTARSPDALVWQWSGGGGTRNGVGDFDVVDAGRLP